MQLKLKMKLGMAANMIDSVSENTLRGNLYCDNLEE